MNTDSTQIMRVLDRCLDTARSGSNTAPGMAAAAACAKTDPELHHAISLLLAQENKTGSQECWTRAMATIRNAEPGSSPCSRSDRRDPITRILSICKTASRATGEADHQTATALAEMLLAAIMLETSSLGTNNARQLRNRAAHSDIAAARALSRRTG